MNFNLISDVENGYDFQTRFREQISVEPNSNVYLNFAQLSKLNSVVFTEDQTLSLNTTDMFPTHIPDAPATQNSLTNIVGTIKKGFYDFRTFQTQIQVALNEIKTKAKQLYYYSTNLKNYNPLQDTEMVVGYFLDDDSNWKNKDLVLDTTDVKDFGTTGDAPYTKTSATNPTPEYDAYAGSDTHYFHHSYLCPEQQVNNNFIICESSDNIDNLNGKIGFGIYSPEHSVIKGGGVNYINGTNLPLTPATGSQTNKTPKCFLFCELHTDFNGHKYLRVFVPRTGANAGDPSLRDLNFNTTMGLATTSRKQVYKTNLNQHLNNYNQPLKLALQLYIPTTNNNFQGNARRVYFRLYLLQDGGKNTDNLLNPIFDSSLVDEYFNYTFFNTYNPPTTKAECGSGIPFKVLLTAQELGEGWASCIYREFDKSDDTATDCRAVINSYTLTVSTQLKKYLENDGVIGALYPNVCELMNMSPAFYYQKDLSLDFLNDSYSVIIEELPIQSYKNKENQADGGYSQHIIANIPSPFVNTYNNASKNTNLIGTLYQPTFKSENIMKNQELRTNHFRVKIMNMRTNEPATELKQSIINFTIEPSDRKFN